MARLLATEGGLEHIGLLERLVARLLRQRLLHLALRALALAVLGQLLLPHAQAGTHLGVRVLQGEVTLGGTLGLRVGERRLARLGRHTLVRVGQPQLRRQLQGASVRHGLLAIDAQLARLGQGEFAGGELALECDELGLGGGGLGLLAPHVLTQPRHLQHAHLLQRLLALS